MLDQGAPSGHIALVTCPCAFRLRRMERVLLVPGAQHFPCKFSRKKALVTCPCAFRFRRLAQNVRLISGARHLSCKFSHKMALVTYPCAFRLCRLAQNVRLINFWSLAFFLHVFLRKMALVTCPRAFRLRRLAQTERRVALCIHVASPWGAVWGACRCHVLEVLVSRSCKIRYSSSRSFCDDFVKFSSGMKILLKVFYNFSCEDLVEIPVKCCQRPLHDLVQALVRSSCRGPGEIVSVSLHDLVQARMRRSCGDPVAILLKRSLH